MRRHSCPLQELAGVKTADKEGHSHRWGCDLTLRSLLLISTYFFCQQIRIFQDMLRVCS